MKSIIIATSNEGKKREFQALLEGYNVKTLKDIDFNDPIIEDGTSFKENALIKVNAVFKKHKEIIISDDSGLEVKVLNNAPGIYSARYAGDMHDDELNNQLLCKNLLDKEDRAARYVCAIAIKFPNGKEFVVEEYCSGEIILTPRGKNGFGYDPYFYLKEYQKTMAEISMEEKNKISHRAKALKAAIKIIKENI